MRKVITVTLTMSIAIISYSCIGWIHIIGSVYAQEDTKNNDSSFYQLANNGTLAKILSDNLVNYLNESASVLQLTSMLPAVSNIQDVHKINSSLHGISDNEDIEKRQIADDILKYTDTFEAITFLLPNGDMYMEEPYDRQLNQSRGNFAFREYFQGAVNTKQAFLGDVIVSSSTGDKVALISVPIYLKEDSSFVGIWSGVLNLIKFDNMLRALSLPDDLRVVFLDSNGQKIADSNSLLSNKSETFVNFNSFKSGKSGKSGNVSEVINGTKFLASYAPASILSKTWIVIVMMQSG
ncbi:MAG TPA: cache domain-containing protein [Nitrososphaeraceae archaeon]|nr:cache domain-containing protein [Nitrososphaeraceae archaeon]